MTNQSIIHPIPFHQMSIQEQYDLVQTSFSEALREVATLPDEATRKVLRDRLEFAMTKGSAIKQHAAITTVRLVVRSIQQKATVS